MVITKTIVRVITTVVAFMLLFVSGYYHNEIRVARRETPDLLENAWRRYGSQPRLHDISSERKNMLIAVEDPTFTIHHGVDLSTPGAGMTTITQGLVKLIYFPKGFRQGIAKIRQTLIARYVLDSLIAKDDQLILFLNFCYLGNEQGKSIHGYANAARVYFGKDFVSLTDEQFLSLLAMHISPNTLKPGTPENTARMRRIKAYLAGEYQPTGLLDVEYNGKQQGTAAEEALMVFLRLITGVTPSQKIRSCD